MNSEYPSGGDLGGIKYRIHEDDYAGIADHKSDSSTGKTLMLSKFNFSVSENEAVEKWTAARTFDKSDDDWFPTAAAGGGPANLLAVIEGTGSASPLIEWRVVDPSQSLCFDGVGTEYTVGSTTPTISAGLPLSVQPNDWNFANVPAGTYELCAKIDANDAITEPSEAAHRVRSEGQITVRQ